MATKTCSEETDVYVSNFCAILLSWFVCLLIFPSIRLTDLAAVGQLLRRHVPEAVFLESIGQEITYILPYSGARDGTFALLFQELDAAMSDLGLTSYGISDTTLEEVRRAWDWQARQQHEHALR